MFTAVKDGGERIIYAGGGSREPATGKGRYDLIPAYPYRRLAIHFQNGYKKYGKNSWHKGLPMYRYFDSLERHLVTFKMGDRTEDHLAAIIWGLYVYMESERMIFAGEISKDFYDVTWKPSLESYSSVLETNRQHKKCKQDSNSFSSIVQPSSSSSEVLVETKSNPLNEVEKTIIHTVGRYDLIPAASHQRLAKCYEEQKALHIGGWHKWSLSIFIDSLERHIYLFKENDRKTDHLALALFYLFGYIQCEQDIRNNVKSIDFNDVPWEFSIDECSDD